MAGSGTNANVGAAAGVRSRNTNLGVAPFGSCIDCAHYFGHGILDSWPTGGAQYDDRNAPRFQVLLVPEVRIGCDEDSKSTVLSGVEKFAVLQLRPAALVGGGDFVVRQMVPQGSWRALVEKDAHLRRDERTARRMLEYSANLLERDAWKPFDELPHRRSVFEIFKEGSDGHTSSAEHPDATDAIRVTLYCFA